MDTKKETGSYLQCLCCGNIYTTDRKIPVSVLITTSECPQCGHKKGLNCGNKEEDIYLYYDPVLDERYYKY